MGISDERDIDAREISLERLGEVAGGGPFGNGGKVPGNPHGGGGSASGPVGNGGNGAPAHPHG